MDPFVAERMSDSLPGGVGGVPEPPKKSDLYFVRDNMQEFRTSFLICHGVASVNKRPNLIMQQHLEAKCDYCCGVQ